MSCTSPDRDQPGSAEQIPPDSPRPGPTSPTTTLDRPAAAPSPPPTTSPTTRAEPAEYHVSPAGSDPDAGNADAPWATIAHAVSRLEAGDTLVVGGGVYHERVKVEVTPGTAEEPVVVRAARGEEPIIEGLLWLTSPDHWVIDGINVTWDTSDNHHEEHMVKVTDGDGWVLRNSELWGAESFAALLIAGVGQNSPRDWRVSGNCIHDTVPSNDTNQDHLIYVNTGSESTGGVIEGNLLFGAENGSAVKLGGSSEESGGAHGVTVQNNTIVDTAQGVLIAWGSSDNVVRENLFSGTQAGYGHIRGYQLDGSGNIAVGNGGDRHEPFILNDDGYQGVRDGGNNFSGIDIEAPERCRSRPETTEYGLQTALAPMPDS